MVALNRKPDGLIEGKYPEYTRKTVAKHLKTNIRQFLATFPSKTVFITEKRFVAGAP
jgi:hypothetical protein